MLRTATPVLVERRAASPLSARSALAVLWPVAANLFDERHHTDECRDHFGDRSASSTGYYDHTRGVYLRADQLIPISSTANMFWGFDVTPVAEIADKVKRVYETIQPPGVDPMLNFDERDLLDWIEAAGFRDVHLNLEAEVVPLTRISPEPPGWDAMLRTAGNPRIPTLGEALERALTPAEREAFVSHLPPLVEARQGVHASAIAYLWATKG